MKPHIVTANALLEGNTVYLGRDRSWIGDPGDAEIVDTSESATRLLGHALRDCAHVVGPRLIEVVLGEDGVRYPRDFRERARMSAIQSS